MDKTWICRSCGWVNKRCKICRHCSTWQGKERNVAWEKVLPETGILFVGAQRKKRERKDGRVEKYKHRWEGKLQPDVQTFNDGTAWG